MVQSCCVVGCTNRQNKEKGISLHRFPKYPLWRREAWIKKIKRLSVESTTSQQIPWVPTEGSRVCNVHFLEGKPSEVPTHPDFVPTQNMSGSRPLKRQLIDRFERRKRRISSTVSKVCKVSQDPENNSVDSAIIDLSQEQYTTGSFNNSATQTEPMAETERIKSLEKEISAKDKLIVHLQQRLDSMKTQLIHTKSSVDNLTETEVKFYTVIPTNMFLCPQSLVLGAHSD